MPISNNYFVLFDVRVKKTQSFRWMTDAWQLFQSKMKFTGKKKIAAWRDYRNLVVNVLALY